MSVKPIDTFNHAIERSDHFLMLYDILHNSRQRGVRADWSRKFKQFMRWPTGEQIERIDGKEAQSILILRESVGISREKFNHTFCSELLRSSLASSISALDRYMHDTLVDRILGLLNKPEGEIPKKLKKLRLPVLITKRALEKLRSNNNSRPGTILKKEIQDVLHNEHTFQSSHGLESCASMLGITNLWSKLAQQIPVDSSGEDTKKALSKVTRRRNQIVHESDLILQTSGQTIKLRDISRKEASDAIDRIKLIVAAFEEILPD